MGCVVCLIVTIFSTKFLWKITPFLYLLGLILMVLPLVFYNPNLVASTGAKNWVAYGNITLFQPSEFMKIPFILMLSRSIVRFLQRNKGRERWLRQDWLLILELTIYTIPVFALLALQQDLGTALVFLAIFAGLVLDFRSFLENHFTSGLVHCWRPCWLSLPLFIRRRSCFSAPAIKNANLPNQSDFGLVKSF